MLWYSITDFGDSAAMLPAAAALLVWLVAGGMTRAAVLWAALFAGESLLVSASKIAFLGWGIGIPAANFTGISGHSTLASSVIPMAAYLATQHASPWLRRTATALAFAAAVVIAVSRVKLQMHSWSEVAAGVSLGAAVALVFMACADTATRRARLPAPVLAGVILTMAVMIHGTRAPSEQIITEIALQLSGHDQPYTRRAMRAAWANRIDAAVQPALVQTAG